MIQTKKDIREYLLQDAKANERTGIRPRFLLDHNWRFILCLRKCQYDYRANRTKLQHLAETPIRLFHLLKFQHLSIKLGFSIGILVFEKGLSIPHYGTIVVNSKAKIGENCRILPGVTIGYYGKDAQSATIGNNVYIGTGAKILGAVTIADNVVIGANAVVTRDILEPGTTWAGSPAKKISDSGSQGLLSPMLFS